MALACSTAPEGRKRWTVRLLAEKMVELAIVRSAMRGSWEAPPDRFGKTPTSGPAVAGDVVRESGGQEG